MKIGTGMLISLALASSVWGYEWLPSNDPTLDAPTLRYDIAYPDGWISDVSEFFVTPPPAGSSDCDPRVIVKFNDETNYRSYTLSEAWAASYQATKVNADLRMGISRASLTHNGNFLEGDPLLLVDGTTIYMTGVMSDNSEWKPIIDIYESPMYPASGADFEFTYKQTYDPGAIDPDFDYYQVGGQIAIKEGSNYVLTFAAYRVPQGKPQSWAGDHGVEIQTQFYQMAHKDGGGNFVWDDYPRMINGYVDRSSLNGNELGSQTVPQSTAPRTHQSWNAPSGGQINGIHLNGDIFEVDGERWFYWVWFEGGNHIASARIADGFTFADANPDKHIWHDPVNIVQNSNPVPGEQSINENATVFKRNGIYYFIFTHGHVVGSYSMSYFMGSSFETIARGTGTEHVLFEAYPTKPDDSGSLWTPGLREGGGSGRAITKDNGDMFMFYGISTFDRVGNYQGRKIHYSPLEFNNDDTLVPLKKKPVIPSAQPAADPLFIDSYGLNLCLGLPGGLNAFEYNAAGYMPEGGCGMPINVADIVTVSGGMHVLSASGLTYFSYDAATGAFSEDGSTSFSGGTALKPGSDGTLFTAKGDGINAWTYNGSSYSQVGFQATSGGAVDLALDASGTIHVIQGNGVAAYTYSGGTFSAIGGAFYAFNNGTSIAIDGDGYIFTGRTTGINAFSFNGSSYNEKDWFGDSGCTDMAISSDETIFAVRVNGWDMDALTFNGSDFTQTGFGGVDGRGHPLTIFVDSKDQIHVGKFNGMIEMNYDPTQPIVGALAIGDWYDIDGGVDSIAEFQTMGTYIEWAQQIIGSDDELADPDFDGVDNWTEYLLGGNPNIADADAIAPVGTVAGDQFDYVYRRRRDADLRGLAYEVEGTDNLISNSWTTVGSEIGIVVLDLYYESVTNQLDISAQNQGFQRLKIEK